MAETQKLPVWETARASFSFMIANRSDFVRAAAIPFLGVLVCNGFTFLDPENVLIGLVAAVGSSVFWVILAIKWHRFFLLGPNIAKPRINVQFDRRFLRFLIYSVVLLGLILVSYQALLSILGEILGVIPDDILLSKNGIKGTAMTVRVLGYVAIFAVFSRLALLFPLVAVDGSRGILKDISGTWRFSRQNASRIFLSIIIVQISVGLPYFAISKLMGSLLSETMELIVMTPLNVAVSVVLECLIVSIVSIAFDSLTGWRDENLVESNA